MSLKAVALLRQTLTKIIMKTQTKLSREEMKAVTGGKLACACNCFGTAGSWNGSYSSADAARNAIAANCSGGGACHCTEPVA
jgi:natural product precursor